MFTTERGMDNECVDYIAKVKDDHDHRPYIEAVQQGYLSENAMDTALIRLFTPLAGHSWGRLVWPFARGGSKPKPPRKTPGPPPPQTSEGRPG